MKSNKSEPVYVPFGGFIMRSPLFPFSRIKNIKKEDLVFNEALFLASYDLYQEHINHQTDKINNSIYKYWDRMCSRCTPFGLFAGCSYGIINDSEKIIVDNKCERHSRLDYYIICSIIKKLEGLEKVKSILKYYPNDSIYYVGDSIRFIDYSYNNNRRFHQLQTIKSNKYINAILEFSKEGRNINELANRVIDSDVSFNEAIVFVEDLIECQILKSELEPSITVTESLSFLINWIESHQIDSLQNLCTILKNIHNTLNDLDRCFNHCPQKYEQLFSFIHQLEIPFNKKHLIHTDVYRPIISGGLSHKIIDKLQIGIDFLIKLSSCCILNKELDSFVKKFHSKYESRPIPLLLALDNDLGIGYPIEDKKHIASDFVKGINQVEYNKSSSVTLSLIEIIVLKKLYSLQIDERDNTIIELEDKDIEPFYKEDSRIKDIDTLSCLFQIFPNDIRSDIYIKSISSGAARLIGRFCYLNKEIKNLFNSICSIEQKLADEDTILAEIIHLPEPQVANIINRPLSRELNIHYLSNFESPKQHIPASDLMLQIKNGELVLFSKSLKKRICPRLSNAHNYNLNTTPLYKFLCSYQYYYNKFIPLLSFNNLYKILGFIPRIQYKSCILHLKTWNVSIKDIGQHKLNQIKENSCIMDDWIIRNKIPNNIVVADGDNELFVDLSEPNSRALLLDILSKRSNVTIKEFLYNHNHSIVSDGSSSYNSEFIIPFHKKI